MIYTEILLLLYLFFYKNIEYLYNYMTVHFFPIVVLACLFNCAKEVCKLLMIMKLILPRNLRKIKGNKIDLI